MKHPLHVKVTQYIEDNLTNLSTKNVRLIKDQACGGYQQIPLFLNKHKSRETEICNVDLAIIKNDKVEVLIEIDTKIIPTQICGKFMTSALSSYHIHRNEEKEISLSEDVLFIQILDSEFKGLIEKEKTAKIKQGENIEKAIQAFIKDMNSKIKEYKIRIS